MELEAQVTEDCNTRQAFRTIVQGLPRATELVLPQLEAEALTECARLSACLKVWETNGGCEPFTLEAVATAAQLPTAKATLSSLLGHACATALPAGLEPSTVLPRQLVALLIQVLNRVDCGATQADPEAALTAYSDLVGHRALKRKCLAD